MQTPPPNSERSATGETLSEAPTPSACHQNNGISPALTASTFSASGEMQRLCTAERSHRDQQQRFNRYSLRGPWDQVHAPLSLIGERATAAQKNSLQQQTWAAIPSRSFKIFQQVFADRPDFVVPSHPRQISDTMIPRFPTKELNPEWYSVLGCLVDPNRISRSLIRNLKLPEPDLVKQLGPEEDPHAATILALKYIWESLKPLPQSNQRKPNCRVLLIGEASATIKERYRQASDELSLTPASEIQGTLLYVRGNTADENSIDGKLFRPLHLQHFSTVYDAWRKTLHEDQQYAGEKRSLAALHLRWQDFRDHQLTAWISLRREHELTTAAVSPQELEELRASCTTINQRILTQYRQLLGESLELLQHSLHPQKRKMEQRLNQMLLDASPEVTQRINPNPTQLRILANQALLLVRDGDIDAKGIHNIQDQHLLRQTIERHQSVFESIRESIELRADLIRSKRRLFDSSSLKQPEISRATSALLNELAIPVTGLQHVVVQPFIPYATETSRSYRELNAALLAGNRAQAEDAVMTLHAITTLHHTQMVIHEILGALCFETINHNQLAQSQLRLTELQNHRPLFSKGTLFDTLIVPERANSLYRRSQQVASTAAQYLESANQREKFPREELKYGLEILLDQINGEIKMSPSTKPAGLH